MFERLEKSVKHLHVQNQCIESSKRFSVEVYHLLQVCQFKVILFIDLEVSRWSIGGGRARSQWYHHQLENIAG